MTKWLLAFLSAASALAQPEPLTIMEQRAKNAAGVEVHFEARLEPHGERAQAQGFDGGVSVGPDIIHRWMAQTARNEYFGYDFRIEPSGARNQFRVSVQPLSMNKTSLRTTGGESWTERKLARYPAPQTMRLGDTLSLDLLVNPYTGQKVVDYFTLVDPGAELRRQTAEGPVRDFRAEDAQLQLKKPRLQVNGKLVEATDHAGASASGQVVFIYLRPYGRLLFSLVPRSVLPRLPAPPFQRAGEIRGSTMTFQLGADKYEINCEGRIAPGGAAYTLYVSQDLAFQPPSAGAADPGDEFHYWVGGVGVD
jgi:hypothetical protein